MKRRPWILIVLAVGHILSPIGNQFLNAYWSHLPFFEYIQIILQPQNFAKIWIHIFAPIVAGLSIYACKKWSFIVYIISMSALFIVSYFGYLERSDSVSAVSLVLVYVINILMVGYFLLPAVRNIYFDPRLRWWETLPRFRCQIPAHFIVNSEQGFPGTIGNFSEGGVFIKSDFLPKDSDHLEIIFEHVSVNYIFHGQVIRHGNQSKLGFGVKFIHNKGSQRKAKLLATTLQARGYLLSERGPDPTDDAFFVWLKKLIFSGKGFVPSIKK